MTVLCLRERSSDPCPVGVFQRCIRTCNVFMICNTHFLVSQDPSNFLINVLPTLLNSFHIVTIAIIQTLTKSEKTITALGCKYLIRSKSALRHCLSVHHPGHFHGNKSPEPCWSQPKLTTTTWLAAAEWRKHDANTASPPKSACSQQLPCHGVLFTLPQTSAALWSGNCPLSQFEQSEIDGSKITIYFENSGHS